MVLTFPFLIVVFPERLRPFVSIKGQNVGVLELEGVRWIPAGRVSWDLEGMCAAVVLPCGRAGDVTFCFV